MPPHRIASRPSRVAVVCVAAAACVAACWLLARRQAREGIEPGAPAAGLPDPGRAAGRGVSRAAPRAGIAAEARALAALAAAVAAARPAPGPGARPDARAPRGSEVDSLDAWSEEAQRAFASMAPHPRAPQAEALLTERIARALAADGEVLGVTCGATRCRVLLAHADEEGQRRSLAALTAGSEARGGLFLAPHGATDDGRLVLATYVSPPEPSEVAAPSGGR